MIEPPRLSGRYSDRHIDCQAALESALVAMIDDANAAGWTIHDITTAITDLADNIALQHLSIADMEGVMLRLKRRKD